MAEVTEEKIPNLSNPIPNTEGEYNGIDAVALGNDFFSKYSKMIVGVVVALAVAGGGYWFYNNSLQEKNQEGQEALFKAVYAFEADSLNIALNGKKGMDGMLTIAEDYDGTAASSLAHFYAGTILLKQGKFADAIDHLGKYNNNDLLVQARAYCLIGDANMELKQTADAITYYKKAATYHSNKEFSPSYYMKLALAQEANGDKKAASETYNTIITEYPEASETSDAKKYYARLVAELGE